ncbi:MAG: hypothetical protein ABRQ38_03840 [Candidatus Eremiobacterota bacterium]
MNTDSIIINPGRNNISLKRLLKYVLILKSIISLSEEEEIFFI